MYKYLIPNAVKKENQKNLKIQCFQWDFHLTLCKYYLTKGNSAFRIWCDSNDEQFEDHEDFLDNIKNTHWYRFNIRLLYLVNRIVNLFFLLVVFVIKRSPLVLIKNHNAWSS
jgi:hypothetical protein